MVRVAMVPADQEDRVAKTEAGETVRGKPWAGGKTVVQPKCEFGAGRWYCVTHRADFFNQLQKDIHIHAGKHRLAWVCFEHGGLEEP